jgi:hypothetical protein
MGNFQDTPFEQISPTKKSAIYALSLPSRRAHLPIDGKADSKPAPSVTNERACFVAQASSLQPMQPRMAALRSKSP